MFLCSSLIPSLCVYRAVSDRSPVRLLLLHIALEAKLKQALFDIEKQEKRLKLSEDELVAKQSNLARLYEDRKVEAATTIKRVRDAHKHKVDLLLAKEKETLQRNEYLKSQVESWESRYRELEEEYRQYKLKTGKSTVGQLQIEIKERDSVIHLLQDEVTRKTHDEQKTKAALQQYVLYCIDCGFGGRVLCYVVL